MPDTTGRRRFLRLSAGTAALGVAGGLSGCSGILDGGDGANNSPTATPTKTAQGGQSDSISGYTNWIYEPDEFEMGAEGLSVNVFSYSGFLSNRESLREGTYVQVKGRAWPQLGIGPEDIDTDIQLPDGDVITGSFDTAAVKEELRAGGNGGTDNNRFESERTYDDTYEIFVRTDQETPTVAYAVGDGTIVSGNRVQNVTTDSDAVSAVDVVTGIIDTGTGNGSRLTESNDDFETLTDTLDTGVSLSLELRENEVGSEDGPAENVAGGSFEGVVADGFSLQIDDETTTYQYVYVYDGESGIDESDIDTWIEANDTGEGTLADLDDISVSIDGRTASVTGTRDTVEL